MKAAVKRVLRLLFRDYQFNRIYYRTLGTAASATDDGNVRADLRVIESKAQFADASDPRIREHAWYVDDQARVYGLYEGGDLVCICAFWLAGHRGMPGRFATLASDEAVMVDLLTAPQSRGKGHALVLARHAERDLLRLGKRRLLTWVWHSNSPSIRVFEKAGWTYSHLLLEFQPRGAKDYLRFAWPPGRQKGT